MRRNRQPKILSKRNVSLFIIVVMVASVFGVLFYGFTEDNSQSQESYNGVNFKRNGNFWQAKIQEVDMEFDYLPGDVQSVNISNSTLAKLSGTPQIDVTASLKGDLISGAALSQFRLSQNLNSKGIYVRVGAIDVEDSDTKLPKITCADATSTIPVIYFKEANASSIYDINNCIIIESASESEFVMVAHKILYSILGVLK